MRKSKFWLVLAVFFLLPIMLAGSASGGQVTLAWDANTEPDLAGYRIWYGQSSGMYGPPTPINVGNVTTYTVNGLSSGVTYYFAATAYDTLGNESGYSNEVAYAPPAITHTVTVTHGPGGTVDQNGAVPVADGASLTVRATPDPGYQINVTKIDGAGFGNQTEHTFSGVSADHTITFTFALIDPGAPVLFSNGIWFSDTNGNGVYDESIDTFRGNIGWLTAILELLN